jgi:carboxyl-terminal processing protease
MPLRNSRGYALALTTGRYYTPSGRSIQRDYGSTSLDDYFLPRDRQPCEQGSGEAKLTDAGRKVYGGDGITPDYCVETPQPSKFVAHLIARQAFLGFSNRFGAAAVQGEVNVSGAGSRSDTQSAKVRVIDRAFTADERVHAEFRQFLEERKIRFTTEELQEARAEIEREIEEEVLRQVFGEGEARRRTLTWDPQVQKALAVMPKAELLLRDPQRFIAERERDARLASNQSAARTP